jgi:hypothetical protein
MSRTWELFALPLPHPSKSPPQNKKVGMESRQWTVLSPHQTQLEKNSPPSPSPTRKKGRPMMQLLVGCMETPVLKLAATTFGLD